MQNACQMKRILNLIRENTEPTHPCTDCGKEIHLTKIKCQITERGLKNCHLRMKSVVENIGAYQSTPLNGCCAALLGPLLGFPLLSEPTHPLLLDFQCPPGTGCSSGPGKLPWGPTPSLSSLSLPRFSITVRIHCPVRCI